MSHKRKPTLAECEALDREHARREAETIEPYRRVVRVVEAIEAFIDKRSDPEWRNAIDAIDDVNETREHLVNELMELLKNGNA